ncbi:MAG: hypothetical protein WCV90_04545 [Candidatus Woesearchaeota archaeon]
MVLKITKKGQVEVTFNWVYILIAGAVILLFFAGIIVKQKAASEDNLDREVVRIMENIFTAAQISENTKTTIDISGLRDYTLFFSCDEGVSKYGLLGRTLPVEDPVNPIFAPSEIKSASLITWSVPYKLPFKVIDFLFVTSTNNKYVLWGDNEISSDFLRSVSNISGKDESAKMGFNVLKVNNLTEIQPAPNIQIRIIDGIGQINDGDPIPSIIVEKMKNLRDETLTAVSFQGAGSSLTINFFVKEKLVWKKLNKEPIRMVSMGGKNDAARYGAIFSGNDQIYTCNMKKSFQRLFYLTEVYRGDDLTNTVGGKMSEMINYYQLHPELTLTSECINYISNNPENLQTALQSHQNKVAECLTRFTANLLPPECVGLVDTSLAVQNANQNLAERGDCIPLY